MASSFSPPVASSVSNLHSLPLVMVYGSLCDSARVLNATFLLVVSLALGALDEAAEAVDGVLSFSPCGVYCLKPPCPPSCHVVRQLA